MEQDQMVLFALRGLVASMSDEQRARVEAARQALRRDVLAYGEEGMLALGLLGAELASGQVQAGEGEEIRENSV